MTIALGLAALLLSYESCAQPVPAAESPATCAQANRTLLAVYPRLGAVQSMAYSTRAFQICKERNGAQHPATLDSMTNLAVNYRAVGRYTEALALNQASLKLRRDTQGEDHPSTLLTMSNLAANYGDLGQPAQALALYEAVLKKRRTKYGNPHPDTAVSMNDLATSYVAMGRYIEALTLHVEALTVMRTTLGTDHVSTLISMSNLARSYQALDRHEEALALYEEVLKLRRLKLGTDHPVTLGSMHHVAAAHRALGAYEKALELHTETAQLMRDTLGADHPATLTSLGNLAMSYRDVGRDAEAVKLNEAILEIKKQKLGADHPGTLLTMHHLAQSYFSVGRLQDIPALGRAYIAGAEKQRRQQDLSDSEQLTAEYANSYRWFSCYFGRLALDESQSQASERNALLQEGFEIADRAKAGILKAGISRQAAGRAGGLAADDQQALERRSGESAALAQAIVRQQDVVDPDNELLQSLQARKREADALYLKLHDKLRAGYLKYAQLLDVKFARPEEAQKLLEADQQVVSYVIENNGNICAWLLDASGEARFIDLGQHNALGETLMRLRQEISKSNERPVSPDLLQTLSAILIHPLLEHLSSAKRWIIIPDGDLALLPFDTLLRPGGDPLIKEHEISVVQSWSAYVLLNQREADYSGLKREFAAHPK